MHKKTEAAISTIKDHLKLYQDFVETSQDIYWQCDAVGRFTFLNSACVTIYGYSPLEMLGHRFSEYQTPEQAARDSEIFQRLLEGETLNGYETVAIDRNGEIIYLVINSVCIYNDKGEIIGARGTAQNITKRKKAEFDLQNALAQYRSIFENSGDGILYANPNGKVYAANPIACRLFGRSEEEIIQVGRDGLVDSSDPRVKEMVEQRRKNGNYLGEMNKKRADGSIFPAEVTSSIFKNADGEDRCCIIFRDISDRKSAEIERKKLYDQTQADAVIKTKLLNEVNHRVKNNLMMIQGLILTEKKRIQGGRSTDTEGTLDKLWNQISSLLHVHALLSDHDWHSISVSLLAEQVCKAVIDASDLGDKPINLSVEQSTCVCSPRIAGNIALALNELTTNSIKYAFQHIQHPAIHITCAIRDNRLFIVYKDNGCGYPEEVLRSDARNVGLRLISQLIEETNEGEVTLRNNNGAETILLLGTDS